MFNAVLETTTRVIGERRLRTLRELGAWKTGQAQTAEEACRTAAQVLAENPLDLPFTVLYLLDADGRRAALAGLTGLDRDSPAGPATIDLDGPDAAWPFRTAAEAGKPVEVADLPAVDRRVEDGGDDLELPGPAIRAAGVDGHLPHQQGLGVRAVLLAPQPVRLVRPLPDQDVAAGPALHHSGPHPQMIDR